MNHATGLEQLAGQDARYSPDAYAFVLQTLEYLTWRNGRRKHVEARELLQGARELALDFWGLLARPVFNSWGVRTTDDFGQIVFRMIRAGLLLKTEGDREDDFRGVFDFAEAFDGSYAPKLDSGGHIRRKLPLSPDGSPAWSPFMDEITPN